MTRPVVGRMTVGIGCPPRLHLLAQRGQLPHTTSSTLLRQIRHAQASDAFYGEGRDVKGSAMVDPGPEVGGGQCSSLYRLLEGGRQTLEASFETIRFRGGLESCCSCRDDQRPVDSGAAARRPGCYELSPDSARLGAARLSPADGGRWAVRRHPDVGRPHGWRCRGSEPRAPVSLSKQSRGCRV